MGRRKTPGLVKRDGVWHIDKSVRGRRICRSTGTDKLADADAQLAFFVEQQRSAEIFGIRPTRTFEQAAAKYVLEHQHKRSLRQDIYRLQGVLPWIGNVPIAQLHMGTMNLGLKVDNARDALLRRSIKACKSFGAF
jgi:hypothetical protein